MRRTKAEKEEWVRKTRSRYLLVHSNYKKAMLNDIYWTERLAYLKAQESWTEALTGTGCAAALANLTVFSNVVHVPLITGVVTLFGTAMAAIKYATNLPRRIEEATELRLEYCAVMLSLEKMLYDIEADGDVTDSMWDCHKTENDRLAETLKRDSAHVDPIKVSAIQREVEQRTRGRFHYPC